MNRELRRTIVSTLEMYGFSIRGVACDYLTETLSALAEEERTIWLEKIIDHCQKQSLETPVLAKENIETAILDGCKNEMEDDEDLIKVISAFETPRFQYSLERKKFLPFNYTKPELYGKPSSKGTLFRERYTIIHQRTLRNRLFLGIGEGDEAQFKLRPVESLLTVTVKVTDVVILGLLTQLKEGKYFLEDPSGIVQVDLSQTTYHDGLFTECCFVLAEGTYHDGILYVSAMGLPPREPADTSRLYFGAENYFGGLSKTSLRNNERLKNLERRRDAMLVFISDVWLDSPKVMEKLGTLFFGYSISPPSMFVLMGNFQSSHKGFKHWSSLKDCFKSLGEIVARTPSIAQKSKFVIIPGPTDSQAANILPRPALPESVISGFSAHVKDVVLATNPCRIQYCTQEIVLVREDLVTKLCRNSVHFPDMSDIGSHFAKTLICQSHLAPLSLNVCPVYWEFDSALRLYPCPDVVVCADQQKAFSVKYNDCHITNPGPFCAGNFAFKVYYPSSKEIEECQIPDT